MKHLTKRLLALALSVAMAATMAPAATVQAASKKNVTVSTQAELTKALATKGVSKITVKTSKAVKFTVKKGTYSAKLEMNAPKATMTNSGTWTSVTVVDAKSFTEKAKNNKVVVKDKKLTFTVAKGATVKSVTFAKKGASETMKINGTVSAMTISSPATVKITDNGSLKKVTVDAKATVTLSGTSNVKATVTLTKNAADSSVKSAVPVAVKASADAAITLKEGAEGSTVAVKTADAKVSMTNSTKDTVEVTKADGTKESVAAGEKIDTSDDEKKEDVKKPAAGDSVGGNSEWSGPSGPSVNPPGEVDTTPSLTLSRTEATISLWDGGETIAITAKNIENVEWKSSNTSVVTVTGDKNVGRLSPVAVGTATITVSGDGIQRVCDVTVTNETKTAAGLQKAVDEIAKGTLSGNVDLCGDINGDVVITYNGTNDLMINFKSYTVNGNVTITSDKANKIFLTDTNATITGNLTVHAPSSHVENSVTAKDVVIQAVSDTTFVLQDVIKGIVQMMGQGTINVSDTVSKSEIPDIKIDTDKAVKLAGNVKKVEVVKPATITVATTVEKIEVKETAATTDTQKVTIKAGENGQATAIQADAPVEIAVPTTEVVASKPVEVKANITSVYVKSDEAKITVDKSTKVSSIAVADSNVTKISVEGTGTVAAMDVTKAESKSVEISVETAATEIPVITKAEQNITTTTGNVVEKKITGIVAKDDVKEETITKGSQPVISGEITVTFSGASESTVDIPVTDQMTLPASGPDSDGWYTIQVTYGGQTCDFLKYKHKEPTIVSVVFNGSAMKTVYKRGETFDPIGAVVTLTYDNGDVKKLTDTSSMEFTWEGSLEQVGKATVSVSKINGITYTGKIDGAQTIIVNPNYYTVDLDLNENGRKVSLPKVTEGAILANLPETSNLATLKPEWPGNSYWTFKGWVTVADRNKVYDFAAPITGNVNLIAVWNTDPPAGKQGIKSVIQQTTAQNSQSILQIFTTGDNNQITDNDFTVSVSRNNGETWEVVSPDLYTGFSDQYISWYGIQFKDQSMFFKTADNQEAPYQDAIFKVTATEEGNLVGWGTCTIVSLVDTFGPSVWFNNNCTSIKAENNLATYTAECSVNEKTTYSYLGVKGDLRSQGNISKEEFDALKDRAIVSGNDIEGPTKQGDYSYFGELSFTSDQLPPEEGMTVYYLFWDKYKNYSKAVPVYFSTGDIIPPDGKHGIKTVIEQTGETNNMSILQIFTTGEKPILTADDLVVTYSRDNGKNWTSVSSDEYFVFTHERLSWNGIQFKDESMFFSGSESEKAAYDGVIFRVSASETSSQLAGFGTCTIVSQVDRFAPRVGIYGSSRKGVNMSHTYTVYCETSEKTSYAYLGVPGDLRSQGNISKLKFDELQKTAMITCAAVASGPAVQGENSEWYTGEITFTIDHMPPEEGETIYYIFWDQYGNYTEAIPVYFPGIHSGNYVDTGFNSNNVTVKAVDDSTNEVSATVQVKAANGGTYSWLVSKKNLGESLTSEKFVEYADQCGTNSDIVQLIKECGSISAGTLTDVPVSFQIPKNDNGDYYIYLIVWSNDGFASAALGDKHHIHIVDGQVANVSAGADDNSAENMDVSQN